MREKKIVLVSFALANVGFLSGCIAPAESAPAASRDAAAGAAAPAVRAQTEAAPPASPEEQPNRFPVRISRTFFEGQLSGQVQAQPAGPAQGAQRSAVAMQDSPPTAPAPEPGYLADFRDYQSCAIYQSADDLQLCFTVAPDVSSVDLSGSRVSAQGLDRWARQAGLGDCSFTGPANARKWDERSVSVYFQGQCDRGEGAAPIQVELRLSSG